MRVDLAEFQTRFVVLPALLPVTETQAGEGEIVTSAGMVGVGLNGLLVGFQGFVHAAHVQQGGAAVGGGGLAA